MAVQVIVKEKRHVYFRGSCVIPAGEDTITIKSPAKVPAGKQLVIKVDIHGVLEDAPPPPEPPEEP